MDSSSWIHGYNSNNTGANNGFMCGYAAASSCTPAELQYREEEQQQFLISSQIQHHLNQISMRMNMDDEASAVYEPSIGIMHNAVAVDGLLDLDPRHAGSFASSSSSSSISFPSASLSCSPQSSSAHVLAAPATAAASQYLEVSSQVPLPPPSVPYEHHHQYTTNLHVPAPAAAHHDAAAAAMAPDQPPAASAAGAFKSYARHLGPKRQPKPGACGQRMFKTAMSVLSKMHVAARYSQQQQQQYYYQQAASAEAAAPPPSVTQLQHMFSERKRREKLNDSFHALKTVLPPGAKKDKTSILIRAREYVRLLESKVSELEEKNRSLESRLIRRDSNDDDGRKDSGGGDQSSGEKQVQVEITRAAKEEWPAAAEPRERDLCTLKIMVRSPCSNNMTTDVVLRTLQCLKDQIGEGVSVASMSTSGGAGASGTMSTSPQAVLTLQIKSPPGVGWEEQLVKDAVAKVVADALTSSAPATASAVVAAAGGPTAIKHTRTRPINAAGFREASCPSSSSANSNPLVQ